MTGTVDYRDVPGFPSYRCGDDGSVWSSRCGGWKRLKPRPNQKGQLKVVLRRDGKSIGWYVSRLILTTFVGPCPDGMVCCHEDDNPTNNALSNLRWDTSKGNSADAIRNKRYTQVGTRHHMAVLDEAKVAEIRRRRAGGETIASIAKRLGVCHQTVGKAARGGSWKGVGA
jgi:hypothetical protein